MSKRIFILLAGLVLTGLLPVACGTAVATTPTVPPATGVAPTSLPTTAPTPNRYGGTLRVGLYASNTTLDPHLSVAAVDTHIFVNVFEKLVEFDEKLNLVPALAESWEISKDGREYTFRLRKGVKFHDGTDFNAEAAKFNFDRIMDPKTASRQRGILEGFKSLEIVDDYTIKLTFEKPFAPLLNYLAEGVGQMISPAAVKQYGKDIARRPVGTGAFQFVEWVQDDHVTLKKFLDYWQKGRPYLDEIIFRPITDETVKLTNLRTGNLDIIDSVPPKDVARLKGDKEIVYMEVPGFGYNQINFNIAKPPFNNKSLRQAIAWAVDRDLIHKSIYFGIGAPAQGSIPPGMLGYDPNFKPYQRDIAKAKEKLAEAGYPGGSEFTLQTSDRLVDVPVSEAIQAQVAEAGIKLKIEVLEWGKLLDNNSKGEFNANRIGWSGRADPDGNLYNNYRCKGANNRTNYCNPEVDKLMEAARATTDTQERIALYRKVEAMIADDAPRVFVHFDALTRAFSPRVQGYVLASHGYLNFTDVWLKK